MTYMQAQMDARTEGRREGILEGMRQGMAQGMQKGRMEGMQKGILSTLSTLVRKGLLSVKDASAQAGMSEQEFEKILAAQN